MTAGVRCHFLLQDIFLTQGLKPESLESPALAGGFYTTNLGCNTLSILLALFHLCSNSMPTYAQSKRPGVMHQHAEKGTILFLNPHSLLPGSLASLCCLTTKQSEENHTHCSSHPESCLLFLKSDDDHPVRSPVWPLSHL